MCSVHLTSSFYFAVDWLHSKPDDPGRPVHLHSENQKLSVELVHNSQTEGFRKSRSKILIGRYCEFEATQRQQILKLKATTAESAS